VERFNFTDRLDGWIDGLIGGWIDRVVEGWLARWMDGVMCNKFITSAGKSPIFTSV
jgi:hypothetical protein